jgi:hypothetical protein
MGNETSSTAVNRQNLETLNQSITNIASSMTNRVVNRGEAGQVMKVLNNGLINCGDKPFLMEFVLNGAMKTLTDFSQGDDTALKAAIAAESVAKNDQLTKASSELLGGIASDTNSTTISDMNNKITNVIMSTVTSESLNESINSINLTQDLELINNGTIMGSGCTFSQNMVMDLQTSSLASKVMKAITDDAIVSKAIADNKQVAESKSSFISFDGIMAIVLGVVVVLGCISAAVGFIKGGGMIGGIITGVVVLVITGVILGWIFGAPKKEETASNIRVVSNIRENPITYLPAFQ